MEIVEMKIGEIEPYSFNNRNHDEQQVDRIAKSISDFGWTQPLVIDEENIVLVGHGRLLAAQKLGLKKVPVLKKTGLTETQKKAYRILDNKLQNDSTWSFDNLELELGFLEDNGFELEPWGLDELRDLFTPEEPEVYEDEPVECENDETFIKLGDVIELGPHRVMCGDSTNAESVSELIGGDSVDLSFYSPPYNAGKSEELSGNTHTKGSKYVIGGNDAESSDTYLSIIRDSTQNAINNSKCVAVNIQMLAGNKIPMLEWVSYFKDYVVDVDVWVKSQAAPAMAERVFTSAFEFIWWFSPNIYPTRAIPTAEFRGTVKNVFESHSNSNQDFAKIHAAGFPIEFAAQVIKAGSCKGDKIMDLFLGTGTTLIASDQLNRICYGMEIEPKYCHVIIERYKQHCAKVGKPFECKINGEKFDGAWT